MTSSNSVQRPDEYWAAIIAVPVLLAVLAGVRNWWKHRNEDRAWLKGEDGRGDGPG